MSKKACRRCQLVKPHAAFRPDPRYRDGFGSWCCACHRERNSAWAKENRERLTEKAAAYRAAKPEVHRQADRKHKAANKQELAAKHAAWAKRNRGKRNATSAKHKAAKMRATPPWADLDQIAAIYDAAAEIQRRTGQRMHVDHIVPLQHPRVCGLHVAANLQILPGAENESKRNKWPIEEAYRQPRLFAEPKPASKQEALL